MLTKTKWSRWAECILLGAMVAANAMAEDVVKLGFLPPLTGMNSPDGIIQVRSAELAVKQINSAGGVLGKPLKLVTVDTKSTPQGAVAAFEQLITRDAVTLLVGPILSTQSAAIIPQVKAKQVATMVGGTAPRLTGDADGWIVRMRPSDTVVATAMVTYVKEDTKFKKVGLIHEAGAFGVGGSAAVQTKAHAAGLNIVSRVEFSLDEKDFRSKLEQLKKSGAEIVIVYASAADRVAHILEAWRDLGRPFALIGSPAVQSRTTQELSNGAGDGAYAVADAVLGQDEASLKFAEAYRREYHSEPDIPYSWTFDAVHVFVRAITSAKSTGGKEVLAALHKIKDYPGVFGSISVDAEGNGLHQVSIVRVENRKPVLVKVSLVSDK